MTGGVAEFNLWIARAEEAMSSNRRDEALVLLDRALDILPRDIHALNAKGALLGGMRRFGEAAEVFERAAAENPGSAELQYNIAFALQCQLRFNEAVARYDRALGVRPNYPEALTNRALCLVPLGRYDEAVVDAESAVRLNPNDARFLNNLGHALFRRQNLDAARRVFETALRIAPNYVDARSNLGRCLLQLGSDEEAILHFEKALAINPAHAASVEGFATACRALERYDELLAGLRALTESAPQAVAPLIELGAALASLDRRDEADACFARAVALEPQSAGVYARIGRAQLELGELDKAEASLAKACQCDPNSPYFLNLYLGLKKVEPGSGDLDRLQAILARSADFDFTDRAHLHFAFAKALSDLGDNEGSFRHVIEANRCERNRRGYDEATTLSRLNAAAEAFSAEILERCRPGGDPSQHPIFILGMARSGSTLVEQMLSASKAVVGLGELRSFDHTIEAVGRSKGAKFPGWIDRIGPDDVRAIGTEYMARLSRIAEARGALRSESARLVDKTLGNFQYVPLIHLAFPNARIIHTRRDPIDTCLSCYRHSFNEVQFSYDLAELGRYYRAYEKLMARWQEILPANAILHVDHEELVSDFEAGARRIYSFCGLEWDDACLSFHDVKRPVRTMSAAQVRQPLMTGRRPWRPSDETLRPLLEELGR